MSGRGTRLTLNVTQRRFGSDRTVRGAPGVWIRNELATAVMIEQARSRR
jgi:hypothetical protein